MICSTGILAVSRRFEKLVGPPTGNGHAEIANKLLERSKPSMDTDADRRTQERAVARGPPQTDRSGRSVQAPCSSVRPWRCCRQIDVRVGTYTGVQGRVHAASGHSESYDSWSPTLRPA